MTNPLARSYQSFWPAFERTSVLPLRDALRTATLQRLEHRAHGDADTWLTALAELPQIACTARLDLAAVTATPAAPPAATAHAEADRCLRAMHPWRKGPFDLAGVAIDSEWRSDWKWLRIAPHLAHLAGRSVLDVGAGNGYYALRMAGLGADIVVGIDPALLYCVQAAAALHFLGAQRAHVLPLRLQDLPPAEPMFDTVLSMGVLYHQRSPVVHLQHLCAWLRPGGQIVLETLVVDGDPATVLVPAARYARMRNVWSIPSTAALHEWLAGCGLTDSRCVDVSVTSIGEQRSTAWMHFESLAAALSPDDPTLTVEGLPAPRRAVFTATKP